MLFSELGEKVNGREDGGSSLLFRPQFFLFEHNDLIASFDILLDAPYQLGFVFVRSD